MGKLDDLKRTGLGNAFESMGAFAAPAVSGATPGAVNGAPPAHLDGVTRAKNVSVIPVGKIDRDPNQPREEFDEEALGRLAESLKMRGQLQPIRVRWDDALGVYVIVCGERRWRAARMAGLPTVSAVVMDGPIEPRELLAIQLVENAVREDLKPVEQAKAYQRLIEANGWSVRQLARELAIDHSGVTRALALLTLPEAIQERVEQGTLAPATAYEISKLGDRQEQARVAEAVVTQGLTRQEAVDVVRQVKAGVAPGTTASGRVGSFEYKISPKTTVTVRFKGEERLSIVQALKAALEQAQAQESAAGDQTAA